MRIGNVLTHAGIYGRALLLGRGPAVADHGGCRIAPELSRGCLLSLRLPYCLLLRPWCAIHFAELL